MNIFFILPQPLCLMGCSTLNVQLVRLTSQNNLAMHIEICSDPQKLGTASALRAAGVLRAALRERSEASLVLATGSSQFETLARLVEAPKIDWSRVTLFHLDEYAGLPVEHPASFRNYLQKRFVDRVPALREVCFINGDAADPYKECARLGSIIRSHHIDLALVGIGENGHLAFNDPPADFHTSDPFIVVELDEACRMQQLGEGWFPTFEEVPKTAITMSIQQIMKSAEIVCSVPDERKANAVAACLQGPVNPVHPASILQQHSHCTVYLDRHSAKYLNV